ncbi:hypothetical protein J7T55_002025 [Diaporthe amygdali]|uniref:uncharacterized protein n=1 Tax=Phomopsis amygdali TaxID=1214568 RepID=UPI0022FECDC6|nr:uncharacterized protein J7T55_002025 [Diaporthe amygdali]KAJ0100665.1 hypothetical protein J7T55_002025 [Diaporthe amygdali]
MKPCTHTFWLGLENQGHDAQLLVSDRTERLTSSIPDCDIEQPSLFVLIGNTTKSSALREVFSVRRSRSAGFKRSRGLHLHVDPSSIFRGRPLLIAEGDIRSSITAKLTKGRCHRIIKRTVERPSHGSTIAQISNGIYSQLLYPFADVFVFFSDDIGGLRQVACALAQWLEGSHASMPSNNIRPKVVIAIELTTVSVASEKKARADFISLLREETARDPMQIFSSIDILGLFPSGSISVDARYRALKELLMQSSDEIRAASACGHFATVVAQPFDCIQASRSHNPVAKDLVQHFSGFLQYIKTPIELIDFAAPVLGSSLLLDNYLPENHLFKPSDVFNALYREIFLQVSKSRVICFEGSSDVMLRSGFIDAVEKHFDESFGQLIRGPNTSARIHGETLGRYRTAWKEIHSNSTCLSCLRRRPQYGLQCGHVVCESCVLSFGNRSPGDPWLFELETCFLCGEEMLGGALVRVHPPTAGVGVLCVDGGGVRGIAPLRLMRRIQERLSLPIPFQRLVQVAFGISSDVFLNGKSIEESTDRFETLARVIFQRRELIIPFLPRFLRPLVAQVVGSSGPFPGLFRLLDVIVSYFADGLYPPQHIEAALKEAFGNEKSISDVSHAARNGTLVGLPAATVSKRPRSRIFTNYNGVGDREEAVDHAIKPGSGCGRVKLWEMAARKRPIDLGTV